MEKQLEDVRKDIRHNERRIDELESTLARVLQALAEAQTPEERLAAVEIYPDLSEGEEGLVGAMLGRAETHVLRC